MPATLSLTTTELSLVVPAEQDQHCLVSEAVDFPVGIEDDIPALFTFNSIEISKRTNIKQ